MTISLQSVIRMRIRTILLLLLSVSILGGCSASNTLKGTAIGAGAGAVLGGVIGKATGKTATGVLVGTAVGGTAGAIIGAQMDKQAAELEKELEAANVERVGEGIQVTFDSAILFAVNSAELSEASKSNLDKLAKSLENYDNTNVLVVGHTDNTGAEDYNQTLSERRASAAANYMAMKGIATSRLSINGFGETKPVADNGTPEGRRENRRVEVAIFASDEYRESLESGN